MARLPDCQGSDRSNRVIVFLCVEFDFTLADHSNLLNQSRLLIFLSPTTDMLLIFSTDAPPQFIYGPLTV